VRITIFPLTCGSLNQSSHNPLLLPPPVADSLERWLAMYMKQSWKHVSI